MFLTKAFVPPPPLSIAFKKNYVRQNFIFSETYVRQTWKSTKSYIHYSVDKYSVDKQCKALGEGGLAIERGRLHEPPYFETNFS